MASGEWTIGPAAGRPSQDEPVVAVRPDHTSADEAKSIQLRGEISRGETWYMSAVGGSESAVVLRNRRVLIISHLRRSDSVDMAAFVAEDHLKRARDKLFAPPRAATRLARYDVADSSREALRAARLRTRFRLILVRKSKAVRRTGGSIGIPRFLEGLPGRFVVGPAFLRV